MRVPALEVVVVHERVLDTLDQPGKGRNERPAEQHVDEPSEEVAEILAENGRDPLDKTASALMNLSVPACRPDDTIASVMAKLTTARVRDLAVIEDGRLVGIISIGDVIQRRCDEVKREANVLRDDASAR